MSASLFPNDSNEKSGERTRPACRFRRLAENFFAFRSRQTKALGEAAERGRRAACAPRIP
jgi:hypothetical protein